MDADQLRQLLNEGIAATKQGDHARGRELLLQVVAEDERMEPAWLWLAAALTDPADRLLALENVLALNPRHPQAQAGAAALRAQLGLYPSPAPAATDPANPAPVAAAASATSAAEADWQPAEPRAPVAPVPVLVPPGPAADTVDPAAFQDDPDQCPYCGRLNDPDSERCPYCGRSLLMPGFWKGGSYQYWLLILVGLQLQTAMLQVVGAVMQASYPAALAVLPGAGSLMATPVWPAAARLLAWVVALLLLLQDNRRAYPLVGGLALLDAAWMGMAYQSQLITTPLAVINIGFAALIALLALSALISQAQARLRRRVVLARGLVSAPQLHDQAQAYAAQGMWALAALHWRRAIGKDPRNLAYYKGLGRAQVALQQPALAISTFRSGLELAPGDAEFQRLIEAVRANTRSS
jgi:tetratricopeptide (TPR) repeat protein